MSASVSRFPAWALGTVLGALTSLPLMALFYLGQQLAGLPFAPYDLFDWLARVLPGGLITLFIGATVKAIRGLQLGQTSAVAKQIEQASALLITFVGGAVFGAIIATLRQRSPWSAQRVGTVGGLGLLVVVLAIEMSVASQSVLAILWLALLLVGWGWLLGTWLEAPVAELGGEGPPRPERRAFLLRAVGGSLSVALAAWGLGYWQQQRQQASGAGQPLPTPVSTTPAVGGTAATPPTSTATSPVPGTRPLITPNDRFYRVDIDLLPVVVDGSTWKLHTLGLFERPRSFTLSDLTAYPRVTVPWTLGCISNPVGGDLIGNTYWTGLRLRDLLRDLGLKPNAQQLRIQALDGFYESVEMADMLDPRTLLIYGMNGESLPAPHGFPLRILVPNRYGMKQPKWIASIAAIDREGTGYWVDRGWSKEAYPQIVSVIDVVAKDEATGGKVPVGGIAWAGDRGIASVEVQVDDGPWQPASLVPPLGTLAWVQWRYDWPATPGPHTLRVRATDGTGARQVEQPSDTYPNGATGYHSVTTTI